jgi:hypothetical protein
MRAVTVFGRLQQKLEIIGQAIIEAIARVTETAPRGRYRFVLYVFDLESGKLAWTTDIEDKAHLHTMLAEHLTNQSH